MDTGWTEEDQRIWRDRKMKPHTILYRYQHHLKEYEIMLKLSVIKLRPSQAKLVALMFTELKYCSFYSPYKYPSSLM